MAFPFDVKEHRVPGQHIREYPRATANAQEEVLELVVKEYIPREGGGGEGVTVLAAHANGFPKVCPFPISPLPLVFFRCSLGVEPPSYLEHVPCAQNEGVSLKRDEADILVGAVRAPVGGPPRRV